MKVLVVSNMYPSKKYPHYGVFVENTVELLDQMPNVQVRTSVMGRQDSKLQKLIGYFLFYAGTVFKGLFGGYDVIYGHFLSHISIPLRIVKKFRPGVRLVLNAHGNDVIADQPQDEKWITLSEKLIPLADRIIVPSAYFRDLMHETYAVPTERLFIYPSGGINTAVFHPRERAACREKYQLSEHNRYIGYVARLEKDKGWDIFLKAADQLRADPSLMFVVVGGGAEEAAFEAYLQQLDLADRIIRYPLLSQKEIAEIFCCLDVFCFPTYRKSESLGLVGLEAMACGTVTVLPDRYGPSSYGTHGRDCIRFSSGDADSLVSAIREALSCDRALLSENAQKTALSFSRQNTEDALRNCFKSYL